MDAARSIPGPRTPPRFARAQVGGTAGTTGSDGAGHYLANELFERLHSTRDLVAFLENGSLDGMWIWDLERRDQVWATHRFRELLGFGDEPDVGADVMSERINPADARSAEEAFERHLADPDQPYDEVVRYRHRDGSTVWVRSRGFALRDGDGRPIRFIGVHTDLTRAMRSQEALTASLEDLATYSGMLERVDRITTTLQGMTDPSQVTASLVRTLGREVGELSMVVEPVDGGAYRVVAADALDEFRTRELARLMEDREPTPDMGGPVGRVLATGEPLLVSDVSGPDMLRDVPVDVRADVAAHLPRSVIGVPWLSDGDRWGAVLVARFGEDQGSFLEPDLALVRQIVSRHETTQRQLVSQLENQVMGRFRELARTAPMGILQLGADGACTFANDHWTALTGRDPEDSLGAGWIDVFSPEDLERLREGWAASRESGEVFKTETRIVTSDGRLCWVAASAIAQTDESGAYTGALIVVSDVTTRRQAEEELSLQARLDPLTGISNRYALFECIDEGLRDLRDAAHSLGLVYLDVDTFKEVNDSLGHEVGDQLLTAVGRRLGGVLRDGDLCARVGGDEFVVLLDRLDDRGVAARVAERVRLALRKPFEVSGVLIHTSASLGVVTVDRDDGVLRADEVLRRADRAMYRAKHAGRDRWVVFSGEMDEQARSEAAMRQEITDAIDEGRVVLHHQPIVDLGTGALLGVEALVRIQHPTRGLLAPAEFLDVAERSGQIVAIGRSVVRESCRQLARWHRTDPDLYLSLNLSGRQVADAGVSDMVLGAVAEFGIRPDRLVVEVTETTLVKAASSATAAIDRIRAAGVRIAIDDFGTGWSSLARLTEISADMVKIDRSFVSSAPQDPMRAAIISAVMHLAGLVALDVVAEGIETEEQRRTLVELGCRVGQGFLFGRPVPAAEVLQRGRALL